MTGVGARGTQPEGPWIGSTTDQGLTGRPPAYDTVGPAPVQTKGEDGNQPGTNSVGLITGGVCSRHVHNSPRSLCPSVSLWGKTAQ